MTKNSTENLKAKYPDPEEAKKSEKDFIFQFVCHESGHRSEPFTGDWNTLQGILDARKEGQKPHEKDYILLVAVLDGEQTTIPPTPLITVKTYSEMLNKKEANDNG